MRKHLKRVLPDHQSLGEHRWLNPFRSSLLHPRLWHINRHSVAGAIAAGLFCGLIPGPLQMPSAALCALLFRVNLPLAMLTTLYTNPLTLVPLYLMAFEVGNFLTGNGRGFIAPPEMTGGDFLGWLSALGTWMVDLGKPLAIGLLALASGFSVTGYFATRAAWRIYLIRAWRQRRLQRQ